MKKIIVLCILSFAFWTSVSAQTDKDDRREELQEKQADKKTAQRTKLIIIFSAGKCFR